MNPNITNTVDQPLFYASVTNGQPPRLSVCFTPGGGFKKDGIDCPGNVVAKAERQIKISLEDKTVMNEAAADLATVHDCGRSLAFRQIRAGAQSAYFYEDDNEQVEGVSLSQVTLQVRNASLVAAFTTGAPATGPVAPVMPGALAGVQEVREAVPAERAQDKLTGSLIGLSPVQWGLYTNCLQQPHLSYTAQYQVFLEQEKAILDVQEGPKPTIAAENSDLQQKLKAAAAHDTLTFIIPQERIFDFIARCQEAPFLYPIWREMSLNGQLKHDELKKTNAHYHRALQAERDYLAQQARNEYNAAN